MRVEGAAEPGEGVPTCAYRVDGDLLERLDAGLGVPVDSYLRGWQVWLEPHGPGGERLEWRLHPPAGYACPEGVDHRDLFADVLAALSGLDEPAAAGPDAELLVGNEHRRLDGLWEVLEVFAADGDPLEPEQVAEAAGAALGRWPDVAGWADHDRLGDLWKARKGDLSVGAALLEVLDAHPRAGRVDQPPGRPAPARGEDDADGAGAPGD